MEVVVRYVFFLYSFEIHHFRLVFSGPNALSVSRCRSLINRAMGHFWAFYGVFGNYFSVVVGDTPTLSALKFLPFSISFTPFSITHSPPSIDPCGSIVFESRGAPRGKCLFQDAPFC